MTPRSKIFHTDAYKEIERAIKDFLTRQTDFMTPATINSPRAVGDAIERLLVDNFGEIIGDFAKEYSARFARRAMADFAFADRDDFYYVIDVKTHRLDTHFNMPNLTSVKRLSRLYEDDANYFVVLKINYTVDKSELAFEQVTFAPIEFISWDCLTIGALGWGQIQIADANKVAVLPRYKRKDWMIEMCDAILGFYPSEVLKINERIDYFKRVKRHWQTKAE